MGTMQVDPKPGKNKLIVLYNIPEILNKTVGLQGPVIIPPHRRVEDDPLPAMRGRGYESPVLGYNVLGLPVYERLQITRNGEVVYTFPDTTIVHVTLPIIVERTMIQGRKTGGTVKEFICEDDHRVRIMGLILNPTSYDYPIEQVRDLLNNVRRGEAVEITGMYLNDLGICNLVFMNVDLKREKGETGCQAFEIEAISDEPVELNIQ